MFTFWKGILDQTCILGDFLSEVKLLKLRGFNLNSLHQLEQLSEEMRTQKYRTSFHSHLNFTTAFGPCAKKGTP